MSARNVEVHTTKTSTRILVGLFGVACTVLGAMALSHVPWALAISHWAMTVVMVLGAITMIFGPKPAGTPRATPISRAWDIGIGILYLNVAYDHFANGARWHGITAGLLLAIGLFQLLMLAMDSQPGNRVQAAARRWASRFTQ